MITAMSDRIERQVRARRLGDYFAVQLRFAERMAELTGSSLSDGALQVTNLHRRLGFGRHDPDAPAAGWRDYASRLDALTDAAARCAWTVEAFAGARDEPADPNRFGCFSFERPDENGAVRIHFHNRDAADGAGPLARRKQDARIAELRAMFAHIGRAHPDATSVRGGSWLYNLEAYRRLFPAEYVASRWTPPAVRLDGTSTWGQILDHTEAVRPDVRDALLASLPALDPEAPWRAFPLRALLTRAPMAVFRRFYRLESGEEAPAPQ